MIFANLANLGVLAAAALLSWWLSGYDTRVTGERPKEDIIRRSIRCALSLAFVEFSFWSLWTYWRYGDRVSGVMYLATIVPLVLLWVGCVSEMLSHIFRWMIDPQDFRESDPDKSIRDLDAIASLIRNGHTQTAIELCRRLKESGDANVLAMETLLEHLGVPQSRLREPKPIGQAHRLREAGRFEETELLLKSLLEKNPADVDAAIMLMRLYVQDLHRIDKASEVLSLLEKEPHVSRDYIEFARRSIVEWSQPQRPPEPIEAQPESVDELIARGFFGTAIEVLEEKIGKQPQDFDLWMKLAETHCRYCGNPNRAEKIIQRMEKDFAFGPEQIESAKTRLTEWRAARN
ncbi:MAG TPA: tetratricopeptide repeat protein [Verrucomicrobiae bacterium]